MYRTCEVSRNSFAPNDERILGMTNAEARIEVIKKAYGDLYESLKDDIDSFGKLCTKNGRSLSNQSKIKYKQSVANRNFKDGTYFYQWPIEIENLSNNNGWIRIEPDNSNMPTDEMNDVCDGYMVLLEKPYFGFNMARYAASSLTDDNHNGTKITHYRPISPIPKPVY